MIDLKRTKKLSANRSVILHMVLAAYLLVAMGLFSWSPLFFLEHHDQHQITVEESGYVMKWKMHHVAEESAQDESISIKTKVHTDLKNNKSHESDHELDVPSDEFIKYVLKIATQAEPVLLFSCLILLWSFLALLKYSIPRQIGDQPVFNIPIRNSIAVLTRTVVLRH